MKLRRRYTLGWIALLVGFLALEVPAAVNDVPGDTLSEHVWFLEQLGGIGPLITAGVAALLAWLAVHFLSPALLHHARRWWRRRWHGDES